MNAERAIADELIAMPLHSTMNIEDDCDVRRVPGGWIYNELWKGSGIATSVFVPIPEDK